jgi:hypothetical protein
MFIAVSHYSRHTRSHIINICFYSSGPDKTNSRQERITQDRSQRDWHLTFRKKPQDDWMSIRSCIRNRKTAVQYFICEPSFTVPKSITNAISKSMHCFVSAVLQITRPSFYNFLLLPLVSTKIVHSGNEQK